MPITQHCEEQGLGGYWSSLAASFDPGSVRDCVSREYCGEAIEWDTPLSYCLPHVYPPRTRYIPHTYHTYTSTRSHTPKEWVHLSIGKMESFGVMLVIQSFRQCGQLVDKSFTQLYLSTWLNKVPFTVEITTWWGLAVISSRFYFS